MNYKVIVSIYLTFLCFGLQAQVRSNKSLNSLGDDIQFVYKDTILEKGSMEKIKEVAEILKQSDKNYYVDSHTCVEGNQNDNLLLTRIRASIIRKKLIQLGVDSLKVTPRGRGEMFPVYIVVSPRHNFKNRIIRFTTRKKQ